MENCRIVEYNGTIIQGDTILKSPAIRGTMRKPIGVKSITSFDGSFDNENIIVEYDIGSIRFGKIGNISEAYKNLKEKIGSRESCTFEELCSIVFEVVDEYFGRFENVKDRLSYYKDYDYAESEDDYGRISELKGKSSAMCVERAALAQNLLKSLGINSIYKATEIIINGKKEAHAFNLVEFEGKCYIFDSTIPTLRNDRIDPLVGEIPKEVFDKISMPMFTGYGVEITHYNPLRDKEVTIVYDSNWSDKITLEDQNNKTK